MAKSEQLNFVPSEEIRRRLETIQQLMGHKKLTQTVNYLLGEATYRKLKELGFEVSPDTDLEEDD